MTAQGLVATEVVDSVCFSRREFHESCGQVGHMYCAPDVVCEQDAGAVAGGKVVNGTLVFGLPVADDQGGSGHHGVWMHEQNICLRCGLRGPVRGDGIGQAGFVLGNAGLAEEHGVAGDVDQTTPGLRRSQRQADGPLGRDRPVRLTA